MGTDKGKTADNSTERSQRAIARHRPGVKALWGLRASAMEGRQPTIA